MPSKMPNTGMGGAAEQNSPILPWITGGSAFLLAAIFVAKKKLSGQQ
jgi:hypothetical protein